MRSFFASRKGKLVPIWVPSYEDDLFFTEQLDAGIQQVKISNIGYTKFLKDRFNHRDIKVSMKDGAFYTFRITDSEILSDNEELLYLDQQSPADINPDDVKSISFLRVMRLDTDALEIDYLTNGVGMTSLIFRSLKYDI
jgi:hypothetical protein